MIREFEGELSGVLMERICRQWAEWWQMTSSSFVSPLDCLTSFLGISLSRAVSSFGLPVYSSIHSRRITKCPKIGHYGRVVFPKLAEAAGNARGVPNVSSVCPFGTPRNCTSCLVHLLSARNGNFRGEPNGKVYCQAGWWGHLHTEIPELFRWYMRPKRGPPLRSPGHCFSRPQVTRSLFFMRKLKQHRSQVVFLNCRGRAVALKMAPGRRSRKTPLGPHTLTNQMLVCNVDVYCWALSMPLHCHWWRLIGTTGRSLGYHGRIITHVLTGCRTFRRQDVS